MDTLVLLLLNTAYGVTVLALVVFGLAIIFGFLGVMNMAHGEFVAMGAYCAYGMQQAGLPAVAALPAAALIVGAIGWVLEWAVIGKLYRRPFDTLLATWGLSIFLREMMKLTFGLDYKSVDQRMSGSVDLLGVAYPSYRLALMASLLLAFALIYVWYRRSYAGTRLRAMVSNPALAASVGIDTVRFSRMAFAVGAASAGMAGCLLAPLIRIEPYMGVDYLLQSFFVLVIGGLGSLQGLFIGSGVVGGVSSVASAISGGTGGYITVLVISILFLWLRPEGIHARR